MGIVVNFKKGVEMKKKNLLMITFFLFIGTLLLSFTGEKGSIEQDSINARTEMGQEIDESSNFRYKFRLKDHLKY